MDLIDPPPSLAKPRSSSCATSPANWFASRLHARDAGRQRLGAVGRPRDPRDRDGARHQRPRSRQHPAAGQIEHEPATRAPRGGRCRRAARVERRCARDRAVPDRRREKLQKRIDTFATDQVSNALRRMVPADQQALLRSLALYADALAQDNAAKAPVAALDAPAIREGYQPGCIGDIASLHARFYAEHWGFGAFSKARGDRAGRVRRCAAGRRQGALAMPGRRRTLASLAIDGDPATGVAHLRWFIVNDALRGSGIGRRLMTEAMRFVDAQRFRETYLGRSRGWTRRAICTSRSALR